MTTIISNATLRQNQLRTQLQAQLKSKEIINESNSKENKNAQKKQAQDITALMINSNMLSVSLDLQNINNDNNKAISVSNTRQTTVLKSLPDNSSANSMNARNLSNSVKADNQHELTSTERQAVEQKENSEVKSTNNDHEYKSVIGDMRLVSLNNSITELFSEINARQDKLAAQSATQSIELSRLVGDSGVKAAHEQAMGAIVSGVVSVGIGAGAAGKHYGALNKESKSITRNLKPASELEHGVQAHKNAIARSRDPLVHKHQPMENSVEATLTQSHSHDLLESQNKRNLHEQIKNDTNKSRLMTDLANQVSHAAKGATEGAYGVNAAEKQKEAELARAARDIYNELSHTHKEIAKKNADVTAELRKMQDTIASNISSANSAIAERIK